MHWVDQKEPHIYIYIYIYIYICAVYDRVLGNFPAQNTIYTVYMYVWFWQQTLQTQGWQYSEHQCFYGACLKPKRCTKQAFMDAHVVITMLCKQTIHMRVVKVNWYPPRH